MARIRSVHPSLFTDEAWVSCSPLARLLYIGLWTDADDQGIFEWRPIQLKMRLLPGDNVDAQALLDELAAAGLIRSFSSAGKSLGGIRDFQQYQRPKKPRNVHGSTPEIDSFLRGSEVEPDLFEEPGVPHQLPTSGENPPQMESEEGVGGGNRKPISDRFEEAWATYPDTGRRRSSKAKSTTAWRKACKVSGGQDALIAAIQRYSASPDATKDAGQFVPGFHKWLTDQRWEAWMGPNVVPIRRTGLDDWQ